MEKELELSNRSVEQCRIIELPKISDPRGNLTYFEGDNHLPFSIKRVYYLYDIPGGADRGAHGHKRLQQLIIAVAGSFDLILDDGLQKKKFHLNRPFQGLYVVPGMWRQLENFSSGAVCLVMASEPYEVTDYIRDYAEFLEFKKKGDRSC